MQLLNIGKVTFLKSAIFLFNNLNALFSVQSEGMYRVPLTFPIFLSKVNLYILVVLIKDEVNQIENRFL